MTLAGVRLALVLVLVPGGGCMTADKPKGGAESGSATATATATGPGSASTTGGQAGAVPLVTTVAEAVAAKGTRVRVRGVVEREKVGDMLRVEDAMSVRCLGATFPDAALGTTAEATGTLTVRDAFVGSGPGSGPVRQGKPAGATQWVLEGCTIP